MEPILTVDNLKTAFLTSSGKVQSVRGVSFSLNKGEIVGIVGESGSGKSVTSMSILRLLPDTARIDPESSILFEGRDLSRLPKKQLRDIRGQKIAMIFQDPMTSLNPVLRVGFQIEEALLQHQRLSKKEAAEKAV